ncbi:MAG: MFS transporter [Burkholderiales bacterium]|nr:MFS transporter [Burkholderiales bacterium]
MYTTYQKKIIITNVCLIIFINALSLGMVTPVFPELILNTTSNGLVFNSNISQALMYSLCVSAVPMASIVGTPVFSAVAEKHKRMNIVLYGLFGCLLSYVIASAAILTHDAWLFLISRVVNGICVGTFAVTNILISDISFDAKERTYNFKLGMLYNLAGSIIGPVMSLAAMKVKVANPLIHSLLMPYIVACGLFGMSIIGTIYCYRQISANYKLEDIILVNDEFEIKEVFNSVKFMFQSSKCRLVAIVFTVYQFANGLFVQGLPAYLAKYLSYTPVQLSYLMIAISMTIMVSTYIYDKIEWLTDINSYQWQLKVAMLFVGIINIVIFSIGHFIRPPDIQIYHHAIFWVAFMIIYMLTPIFKFSFNELFANSVEGKDLAIVMGSMPQISQVGGFLSGILVGVLLTYKDILLFSGISYMLAFILLIYYFYRHNTYLYKDM